MTHNERGTARDPESVRLGDGDLRDNQEEIVRRVTEYVAALHTETLGKFDAVTQQLGTLATSTQAEAIVTQLGTLAGTLAEIEARRSADKTEILGAVGQVGLDLATLADATALVLEEVAVLEARRVEDRAALDQYAATIIGKLDQILGGDPTWRETKDLIDPKFRPVLGVHTGGGSSFTRIQEALGHPIQVAPIYWKTSRDPREELEQKLNRGTLPRLELCFPHIVTSLGHRMGTLDGKSFWGRVPDGGYDEILIPRLQSVAAFMDEHDQAILLSLGHESDLTVEDGSSPKTEDPDREDMCGEWEEYPAYHAHLAALARQYAPQARIFLNFSGGYSDAPKRWSKMLPPAGTFDFFGWDPYSQYGKTSRTWESFESRLKLFGRWDWYKEKLPDVPVIIGETGVCAYGAYGETDGKHDAGEWLLDMVDFMVENRWQGVGTGGGISQIHYFSHHYDAHPRCLDDNGTHAGCNSGQRGSVLAQIGADPRLAWSA